ncbi:hypothetical protein ACFYYH_29575 [Streptomyces sp. NPDC002018]|uniref:hypothetical protein n=1 Tax=Streptomyces sp. NPDC002018 TaxID=3364629 RepID=UPI0036AEB0AE
MVACWRTDATSAGGPGSGCAPSAPPTPPTLPTLPTLPRTTADGCLHFIDIARSSGATESPMQRVRLDTAHGHILLSDQATRDDGHLVLDQTATVAAQYGLVHQLRSIEGIKAMSEGPTSRRHR